MTAFRRQTMEMTGEFRLDAPRESVWAALNDVDVLRGCVPGCDEMERTADDQFTAKVTAKVGPVKAKFTGKVTLSDMDPPNGYTISGEGQGGAAGFAKGGAKIELADDGDGTILRYTVDASVGGKLAQIGSRLIDGTAKKMADEFFTNFAEAVGSAPSADAASAEAADETAAPSAAPKSPAGRGLSPSLWITLLVIAAVILVVALSR
jgi:carbon monoxide dehydrogenase subunit G